MNNFIFRSEELTSEQVQDFYVESNEDREIVTKLMSQNPILLIGSRGVGKTFLFKVACSDLDEDFPEKRILPVFTTFRKASIVQASDAMQFHAWMLSRICADIIKTLRKKGFDVNRSYGAKLLLGSEDETGKSKIQLIAEKLEASWKHPKEVVDTSELPTLDDFIDAIEDVCDTYNLHRIILFIDEAAHVFLPEQQRQFFTLFRDLRSPYIKCNAAVYPGVTVYGEVFEPQQDATVIQLNRKIDDPSYIDNMKNIVLNQVTDSQQAKILTRNGERFSLLAYAAGGNPRHLLRTVEQASKMDSTSIDKVIRTYYREAIWAEHSNLAEKYGGYKNLILWGRDFIEKEVVPAIKAKNDAYISEDKPASIYFWIDRNAPQKVKESLRILEYSGIIYEHSQGIRASRDGIGTRYAVNIGCLLAAESNPLSTGTKLVSRMTIKRMTVSA